MRIGTITKRYERHGLLIIRVQQTVQECVVVGAYLLPTFTDRVVSKLRKDNARSAAAYCPRIALSTRVYIERNVAPHTHAHVFRAVVELYTLYSYAPSIPLYYYLHADFQSPELLRTVATPR